MEDIYEIDRCVKFIQDNGCEQVALQFPDSMLADAVFVTKELNLKTNARMFLLADTSYGSYDIDEVAAQHIYADLLIHYGKSALTTSSKTKTLFVFGAAPATKTNFDEICKVFMGLYPNQNEKIFLLSESSYTHIMELVDSLLKEKYHQLSKAQLQLPSQPEPELFEDSLSSLCNKGCPDCLCAGTKNKLTGTDLKAGNKNDDYIERESESGNI